MVNEMIEYLYIFSYFIIYAFIGWIVELTWRSIIEEKKFVKETGFLIGPWCPIYGVGALLIIFLLNDYKNDIFALFIIATVLCTSLEYITSFLMEKAFGRRWWDYSNYKFNLNGRICLLNSTSFGIAGVVLVKYLHPFLTGIISKLPSASFLVLVIFVLFLFLNDLIMSLITTIELKGVFDKLSINKNKRLLFKKDPKRLTGEVIAKKPKFIIFFMIHILKRFPNLINSSGKEIKKGLTYLINFPFRRKK